MAVLQVSSVGFILTLGGGGGGGDAVTILVVCLLSVIQP